MGPEFFSQEWADAVRDALAAGPSEQAKAGKLQEDWDFFDWIKSVYPASWALGCRERPGVSPGVSSAYLVVQWGGGTVTDCRIIGPDEPAKASYLLGMNYPDWQALHPCSAATATVIYP